MFVLVCACLYEAWRPVGTNYDISRTILLAQRDDVLHILVHPSSNIIRSELWRHLWLEVYLALYRYDKGTSGVPSGVHLQ